MRKVILFAITLLVLSPILKAQSFSINTDGSIADTSAILDVKSTAKGILIPRMTKAQRNLIFTPATGVLIFQTGPDSSGFHYYDGTKWVWLAGANNSLDTTAWLTKGNSGTNITDHFIGTKDNAPLSFRQNNLWLGRWNKTLGNYSIGDSAGANFTSRGNIAIGNGALKKHNTASNGNIAIGDSALINAVNTYPNVAIGIKAMSDLTTGTSNTAVGAYAMRSNNGINNTAIGQAAMFLDSTTSNDNTAIGNGSLYNNKGNTNTAIGSASMSGNKTGNDNVAIGVNSLYNGDSASNSVAIGRSAGLYNKRNGLVALGYRSAYANSISAPSTHTLGIENTAIGYRALQANSDGNKNTAVGYYALATYLDNGYIYGYDNSRNVAIGDSALADSYGKGNTAVGTSALANNQYGYSNTAVGDSAMGNSFTGVYNEAFGQNSLKSLKYNGSVLGYWNTAIGSQSMEYDTSANATVAVGFRSLRNAKKVIENTAVGVGAMEFGDTSYRNTAIGRGAMYNFGTASENVAVGTWSMSNKKKGVWNTAVGHVALEQDTSGNYNTGIGTSAFRNAKNASGNTGVGFNVAYWQLKGPNTYIGFYAGFGERISAANMAADTGVSNTAVGDYAMYRIAGGGQNVAMGESALGSDSSGSQNTAIGAGAMDQLTQGHYNTSMGFWSSRLNTTGNGNTSIGYQSLYFNTGNYNTGLGYGTGITAGITNATAIGNLAFVNTSNSMVLGSISGVNGAATTVDVGIGTTSPTANLDVTGDFKLGVNGTVLNKILKVTINRDITSIAAGTTSIQSFTVTNAALGGSVFISPSGGLTNGLVIAYARVSAANTVEVKFTNTTGAAIDPAALDYYITVIQ